jgi:hypothetical protein
LLRCDPDGLLEVEVMNCQERALCWESKANELAGMGVLPTCLQGCSEGAVRCAEADLQVCQDQRWELQQTCPSSDECSASGGCRPCTEGEVECNANRLRRCSNGAWEIMEKCRSPALCDATGEQCLEPACPGAGAVACLPEGLSRCAPDQRDWQVLDFCASDDLCNANDQKCDMPVCGPEARRCVGDTYQVCNGFQTGWSVGRRCDAGQLCDLARVCADGGCTAGAFRCNDVYLEECDGNAWQRMDRCATAALCDAASGVCNAPTCGGALPNFDCLDRSLRACSPDRDGWVDIDTCSDAANCDAAHGACL